MLIRSLDPREARDYTQSMSTTPQPIMSLRHVTKRYDATHGVLNLTLDVQPGEVFGFLGPNGAGKSTTINTILDLLRLDEGEITIFGLDHQHDSLAIRRRIGYVSGDMETDPTLTGQQYLSFVAHQRGGVSKDTVNALAVRLHADLSTKIKHLSRGNRQKIGLVSALMHDPDLLILDEPTSGLDPLIQAEFYSILRDRRTEGKTTFMSSHILSEVQGICDRVGFVRAGKLVNVTPLDDLLHAAPQEVSALFVGAPPLNALKHVPGIRALVTHGNALTFDFTGDTNQLVRVLASQRLKSLTIAEPDLEKLFMHYYQSDTREGAHVS